MAIYHLSMQIISRSKGQSSISSASYRSGEKLTDERTNETKYYHREVKPDTMILTPSNSPSWAKDRNRLWNEVEKVEKRKDSQLARELNIALPRELSNEQQKELIQTYAQNEFVNKGMIADIAIHRDDNENPHAHIMLTMRNIDEKGFGKKNRDWNADFANAKENNRGFVKSVDKCLSVREQWANYANKALEKAQVNERISHLSNEARGLETLPTVHLGHVASKMENEGKRSERGDINRERQEYNAAVIDLQKVREEKQRLEKEIQEKQKAQDFSTDTEKVAIKKAEPVVKGTVTLESIAKRNESITYWEKKNQNIERDYHTKQQYFDKAVEHFKQQESIQAQIAQHEAKIESLKTYNPFKLKANNEQKARLETAIEGLKQDYSYHEEHVKSLSNKLNISAHENFDKAYERFSTEKAEKLASIQNQNKQIQEQRSILAEAEEAIKQAKIREVTSNHPDLETAGKHMTYQNALKLERFANHFKSSVPSLDKLNDYINTLHKRIKKAQQGINLVKTEADRVKQIKEALEKRDAVNEKIEKINNNPLLKTKLSLSKRAKNDYESLEKEVALHEKTLKLHNYKDESHLKLLEDKVNTHSQQDVPKLQESIQKNEGLLDIFNGALQAIEQAQRTEQAHNKRMKKKSLSKGKQKEQGYELGG